MAHDKLNKSRCSFTCTPYVSKQLLLPPHGNPTSKRPNHLPNPWTAHPHRLPLGHGLEIKFREQARHGLEDVGHG